jgi:hypothetical protein
MRGVKALFTSSRYLRWGRIHVEHDDPQAVERSRVRVSGEGTQHFRRVLHRIFREQLQVVVLRDAPIVCLAGRSRVAKQRGFLSQCLPLIVGQGSFKGVEIVEVDIAEIHFASPGTDEPVD